MTEFAEACYDQNSIKELAKMLERISADKTDLKIWGITATEWRNGIKQALKEKVEEL